MLDILNVPMCTESIKRKSMAYTPAIFFLVVCSLQMVNCLLNTGVDGLQKGSVGGGLKLLTFKIVSEKKKIGD